MVEESARCQTMTRKLVLPKESLDDIRTLVVLTQRKLETLRSLLGTGDSITFQDPDFVQKVSEELELDSEVAGSVVLVSQFLLTVAEGGVEPDEILSDVRSFLLQNARDDEELIGKFESNYDYLKSLLMPQPGRSLARKIQYLSRIQPTADSFRTVCELRPVFDSNDDEHIVGYVPIILLQMKQSGSDDEENMTVFNLSTKALAELDKVIQRAKTKLFAIRSRFGKELLGDDNQE